MTRTDPKVVMVMQGTYEGSRRVLTTRKGEKEGSKRGEKSKNFQVKIFTTKGGQKKTETYPGKEGARL
jgi:hypothetical protein